MIKDCIPSAKVIMHILPNAAMLLEPIIICHLRIAFLSSQVATTATASPFKAIQGKMLKTQIKAVSLTSKLLELLRPDLHAIRLQFITTEPLLTVKKKPVQNASSSSQ